MFVLLVCVQEQSFLKRDKSAPAITQNLFVEIVRENAAKMYRSDGVSETAVNVTVAVTVCKMLAYGHCCKCAFTVVVRSISSNTYFD